MNTFINADIQIANVETKMASTGNTKYILTDQNKKKYYFYKDVKGTSSDVYDTFTDMEVKIGSVIHISFTQEAKTFTDKSGKEVQYTDRFIGSIREAGGNPQLQQEKPRQVANNASQTQEKDDSFWDKKAYKQCLWNYWLQTETAAGNREELTQAQMDLVWVVFRQVNKDAEKRFSPVAQAALKANPNFFETVQPDAPEDLDTIRVEDIPFN